MNLGALSRYCIVRAAHLIAQKPRIPPEAGEPKTVNITSFSYILCQLGQQRFDLLERDIALFGLCIDMEQVADFFGGD